MGSVSTDGGTGLHEGGHVTQRGVGWIHQGLRRGNTDAVPNPSENRLLAEQRDDSAAARGGGEPRAEALQLAVAAADRSSRSERPAGPQLETIASPVPLI